MGWNDETTRFPPLAKHLSPIEKEYALILFRRGSDTVAIASRLSCTQAAAANAIAELRDAKRPRHIAFTNDEEIP